MNAMKIIGIVTVGWLTLCALTSGWLGPLLLVAGGAILVVGYSDRLRDFLG